MRAECSAYYLLVFKQQFFGIFGLFVEVRNPRESAVQHDPEVLDGLTPGEHGPVKPQFAVDRGGLACERDRHRLTWTESQSLGVTPGCDPV